MVRIYKLTDKVIDPSMSPNATARQIKLHVLKVGHGVGNIDFSRSVLEMSDSEYQSIVDSCDEYGRFKLGNLSTYFELDIYPEHSLRLIPGMPSCKLRDEISRLTEGYLTIRKYDDNPDYDQTVWGNNR